MATDDTTRLKADALQLIQQQAFPRAGELYQRIVELEPDSAQNWFMLGAISGQTGNIELAISSNIRATELNPTLADAWLNLYQAYRIAGQMQDAMNCLQNVIKLQPGNIDACVTLAQMYVENNEVEQALACLEHARDNGADNNSHVLALLGSAHSQRNDHAKAVECFTKACLLSPGSHELHYNLGLACNKLQRYEQAVQALEKAITLTTAEAEYFNQYGLALKHLGRKDDATNAFRKALTLEPKLEGVRFMLAALGSEPVPGKAPEKYVSGLFDGFAGYFDEHLTTALEYRTPQILNDTLRTIITAEQCHELNILDLGCGTGLFGPLIRDAAAKLTGVDLSGKMLDEATKKNIYDTLAKDDLAHYLETHNDCYDLIVAADVFPYIGDLAEVFTLATQRLNPRSGYFAFSTEAAPPDCEDNYLLTDKRRYAHTRRYLTALAAECGLTLMHFGKVDLRKDGDRIIAGFIVIATTGTVERN